MSRVQISARKQLLWQNFIDLLRTHEVNPVTGPQMHDGRFFPFLYSFVQLLGELDHSKSIVFFWVVTWLIRYA